MLGQIGGGTHVLVLGERRAGLTVSLFRNPPAPLVDLSDLALALGVGHHHEPPSLHPAATGRTGAGVEHFVDQLLGHRIRLEPPHAAAGIQNVKDVIVSHEGSSLLRCVAVETIPVPGLRGNEPIGLTCKRVQRLPTWCRVLLLPVRFQAHFPCHSRQRTQPQNYRAVFSDHPWTSPAMAARVHCFPSCSGCSKLPLPSLAASCWLWPSLKETSACLPGLPSCRSCGLWENTRRDERSPTAGSRAWGSICARSTGSYTPSGSTATFRPWWQSGRCC